MDKENFTKKVLEAEITMYRIAKSMLLKEKDCEDVVQNAILKAFEKLETLKKEEFFKTWLVRILINECYKFKKANKQTSSYEEYFGEGQCEEIAFEETMENKTEEYQGLYKAIERLKPKIRAVVILYYIEEYSEKEIKNILKIPAGTVKSRLFKGRKELKAFLEEGEEE